MRPSLRSARRTAGLVAVAVALALLVASSAFAATPSTDIHSTGPLSDIYIGNDLGCQVRSGGFSSTEYFPNASGPGDCGTFMFTGSDNAIEELLGPDFANHSGGTNTTGKFPITETPYTPVSQSMAGSGTAADPYQVTTVVTANDPQATGGGTIVFRITEVDTYVVGSNSYRSDITVTNVGNVAMDAVGQLYHAADCQLRGSDSGFGAAEPPQAQNTAACTVTALNKPTSAREEFDPVTTGANWIESTSTSVWGDLTTPFPDGCGSCGTNVDNGTGIEWPVNGLGIGNSDTFSFLTTIVDTVPTGRFSFGGPAGSTVGGTVATITDPNTSATPSAYSATIDWGDGNSTAGTITGGNGSFNVAGTHAYSAGGSFPVAVTITSVGTDQGSSTVTDSASITSPPTARITAPADNQTFSIGQVVATVFSCAEGLEGPGISTCIDSNGASGGAGQLDTSTAGSHKYTVTATSKDGQSATAAIDYTVVVPGPPTSVQTGTPPFVSGTSAAFTGSVDPGGLPTTAFFQYALDPKYTGGGPLVYTQSTPAQSPGSDFSRHVVSASVTGLVPNALYHVRLVASNSAGTTFGPDVTFTTQKTPPPGSPTLGKTFNITPVSGLVRVEVNGVFVPLTQVDEIPNGALIDARHASLNLTITVPAVPGGARDVAAMASKHRPKLKTESGTFGGAIFRITQATRGVNRGLATLALVEGAFPGAPTYATCARHKAGDASAASLSSFTLQLLRASAHGRFRTRGRYSAATVRGTKWTIADRCDGTLTHDITDSVVVNDFVHHKTVILHAGQRYLARK
jgi:hypothetical protein